MRFLLKTCNELTQKLSFLTAFTQKAILLPKNVPNVINNTRNIVNVQATRHFSNFQLGNCNTRTNLLANPEIKQISGNIQQCRTVTKFSLGKGKRKSVQTVLKRFYRLNWGIWIRTKCGRNKKLWKKTSGRKRRLRQHVFCNAVQSNLLDKMVGKYWQKPRYYVDDPYEPYHTREEFMFASKKPKPYIPNN